MDKTGKRLADKNIRSKNLHLNILKFQPKNFSAGKVLGGQNFSPDKIFGTVWDFQYFCPPKYYFAPSPLKFPPSLEAKTYRNKFSFPPWKIKQLLHVYLTNGANPWRSRRWKSKEPQPTHPPKSSNCGDNSCNPPHTIHSIQDERETKHSK